MRGWFLVGLVLVLAVAAGCQEAPPTLMVLVLTPTPIPADATDEAAVSQQATEEAPAIPATSTPAPTATPDPFPTPTLGQMQVAEQPFERGRMFWIQPRSEIWVLAMTDEGRGRWIIYPDTFEEGMPEFDPDLEAPAENVYQPRRGFGKLWRENEDVREMLGWAVTPDEFGYISRYEYHPGGSVNGQGQFVPGPGYHILFSLYEEAFRFNEADQSWQLGRGE